MKRLPASLLLLLCTLFSLAAQQRHANHQEWLNDIRAYKHAYIEKALDLTRDQKDKFFEYYDRMDEERFKANEEARRLTGRIMRSERNGEEISDTEYEACYKALIEVKNKEYQIEKTYYDDFAKILTKKQLFKLPQVEREITAIMVTKHLESKGERPDKQQ